MLGLGGGLRRQPAADLHSREYIRVHFAIGGILLRAVAERSGGRSPTVATPRLRRPWPSRRPGCTPPGAHLCQRRGRSCQTASARVRVHACLLACQWTRPVQVHARVCFRMKQRRDSDGRKTRGSGRRGDTRQGRRHAQVGGQTRVRVAATPRPAGP